MWVYMFSVVPNQPDPRPFSSWFFSLPVSLFFLLFHLPVPCIFNTIINCLRQYIRHKLLKKKRKHAAAPWCIAVYIHIISLPAHCYFTEIACRLTYL